ncbi:MAG: OmpP1/FadL family transporter [Yoonia sp.]|uniref:OmpP1/FadL family transporter n=1 Tax=Yoonia sp. TaxID=2212373 RepID=UPI003EF38755
MKNVLTAGAALLMTTTLAQAGGLDRSGQGIGIIFEEGTYSEFSFGLVQPNVSGELNAGVILESGNVAENYAQLGAGYKSQINDDLSFAVIFDQPFGANVSYTETDTGYPLSSTDAEFRSTGVTVLGRYNLNNGFSVHGGLRAVTIGADSRVSVFNPADTPAALLHEASYENDTAFGAVVGGAYERPEIALRVALTYSAAMDFSHETEYQLQAGSSPAALADVTSTTGQTTDYTIPQSVNLDFQSGIAADTLLFGSVRWVEWTETEINSPEYFNNPMVSYDNDTFTYNLGIGRRFTDSFSGSLSFSYEKASGEPAQDLAPTDGSKSISLGGAYTVGNGLEISGGVRYVMLGDATTNLGAEFEDNSATAVGMKLAYTY